MNPRVPDELISAYFDGEISPEERAEIESLLSTNDDAQRDLNETARLSALLHSFPREAAPAELAANVLRRTDQISLTVPSRSILKRGTWQDWKAGLFGAAITSLSMCLIVALNSLQFHQSPKVHVESELPSESEATSASVAKSQDPFVAARTPEPQSSNRPDSQLFGSKRDSDPNAVSSEEAVPPKGESVLPQQARMLMARKSSGPQFTTEMPADAAAASNATGAIEAEAIENTSPIANETGLTNEEFVNGLREGKVYVLAPQPADPDNNVAVVYLEVVDIDRSSEQMQVLLKKNSITPRSFNKDVKPMPDDLVVMYVVAPGDKLAKTLKDVDQHRELFSNWTAQAPLQLAGNPEASVPETAKKEIVGRGLPQEQKNENLKQGSAEADVETPEVQVVLDAYAQRNGFGNAIMSNSSRSSNAVSGGNLGGVSNSQLPQNSNSVPEKRMNERASRTANLADQRLQSRALGNSQPGYDLVRLNNPLYLNNDQSSGMSNTTQLVLPRMEFARKQLAFNDAEKATRESNPRALRMLLVLHPQGDGMPAVEPQ